jgi:hypothetical protein
MRFRVVLFAIPVLLTAASSTPNQIYRPTLRKLREVDNGILFLAEAPENTSLDVMHLYGNATERGIAQGQLLAKEILQFIHVELDDFYRSQADQIPLGSLPSWLAGDIRSLLDHAAPTAFALALEWVYEQQKDFINEARGHVWQEAAGIAHGVCLRAEEPCDEGALLRTIKHLNMLPELIRMQCSMMGAWGAAVPGGKLVQLRSLDFGGGPFANRNLLAVHHPSSASGAGAFASLSFPSMVGAVTGFSEHMALSEKVDDVTGSTRPKGTYKGRAVAMVIREILQFARTKEEALAIAQAANRTWSVWLGFGDNSSQEFRAVLYDEDAAQAYDDQTLPTLTHQQGFKSIAYIDKHPQPSSHPDMPKLMKQYYGNLTANTVVPYIPRLMRSGDVHIVVTDWGAHKAYIATGTTNGPGGNYTRLACDAPFVELDMAQLWDQPHPKLPSRD